MAKLYELIETNNPNSNRQNVKKVEILFDMKADPYLIPDMLSAKRITCVCGTTKLNLRANDLCEEIVLKNINTSVVIASNVLIELHDYSGDARVAVEYLEIA